MVQVNRLESVARQVVYPGFRQAIFDIMDVCGVFYLQKSLVEGKLRNLDQHMGYSETFPEIVDYGNRIADILPDRFTPAQFITCSRLAADMFVRDRQNSDGPKSRFDGDPKLGQFLKSTIPLIAEAISLPLEGDLLDVDVTKLPREELHALDYRNQWTLRVQRDFRNYRDLFTQA